VDQGKLKKVRELVKKVEKAEERRILRGMSLVGRWL